MTDSYESYSITAEEASSKRENVKKLVLSILCSSKDGLTEQELRYEYRSLTNEVIPYTQLGYKSVYELMRNLNVARISRLVTGQYVFHAVYDELTQELGALVVHQIDRSKSQREMRRVREGSRVRNNMQNRFGSTFGFSHPFFFGSSPITTKPMNSIKPFVPSNVQKNIQAVLEAQQTQSLQMNQFQLGIFESKLELSLQI